MTARSSPTTSVRVDLGPGQQLDVRLDSRHTQELLCTTLRGAQEFLSSV